MKTMDQFFLLCICALLCFLFFFIAHDSFPQEVFATRPLKAAEPPQQTTEGNQHQFSHRQQEVVDAFLWAWKGYKEFAWGSDELKPLSKSSNDWLGLGLTLIDALDTMWIMGLVEEFSLAKEWVSENLDFNKDVGVNVFETTIRVLGGLLSAHHLSGEEVFLEKASMLGNKLSTAFTTPSSIPWSDVNLEKERGFSPGDGFSCLSEVSTLQLEFRYLSRLTGNHTFSEQSAKAMESLRKARKRLKNKDMNAIPPIYLNPRTGNFEGRNEVRTLGARADSYYEYLLKQWLLDGRSSDDDHLLEQYSEAIGQMLLHLIKIEEQTDGSPVTFVGELEGKKDNLKYRSKMDHLVCFLPGTLALGHFSGVRSTGPVSHLDLAKDILNTCMMMYNTTATKLGPEIAWFSNGQLDIKIRDAHNILRPETIESLFYLYRITGDSLYQDWGWMIFEAFEKYSKVPTGGYAGIKDVRFTGTDQIDKMESFFLSETLKYFFLLFSEKDVFPLDEYVFNTEAHPFPIYSDHKHQYIVGKMEEKEQDCSVQFHHDKSSRDESCVEKQILPSKRSDGKAEEIYNSKTLEKGSKEVGSFRYNNESLLQFYKSIDLPKVDKLLMMLEVMAGTSSESMLLFLHDELKSEIEILQQKSEGLENKIKRLQRELNACQREDSPNRSHRRRRSKPRR